MRLSSSSIEILHHSNYIKMMCLFTNRRPRRIRFRNFELACEATENERTPPNLMPLLNRLMRHLKTKEQKIDIQSATIRVEFRIAISFALELNERQPFVLRNSFFFRWQLLFAATASKNEFVCAKKMGTLNRIRLVYHATTETYVLFLARCRFTHTHTLTSDLIPLNFQSSAKANAWAKPLYFRLYVKPMPILMDINILFCG